MMTNDPCARCGNADIQTHLCLDCQTPVGARVWRCDPCLTAYTAGDRMIDEIGELRQRIKGEARLREALREAVKDCHSYRDEITGGRYPRAPLEALKTRIAGYEHALNASDATPAAKDVDGPRLELVTLQLCSHCLDGSGGECHVPGCALWLQDAPDSSIREFTTPAGGG